MSGILYVVATPIGNLEDFTLRARETLANVDLIAAEDTRRTQRLLSHFGIKARLLALHEHNETGRAAELISALEAGRSVALVSDAGTPLISDPGYRIVNAARSAGITVTPVPGPSALTAALSVSGLPTDRFCFEGFLPSKQAARIGRLAELRIETRTLVIYESVHRIAESLADLETAFGANREAFIARELTKVHEQCRTGTLGELRQAVDRGEIVAKGEVVLVIAGCESAPGPDVQVDRLLQDLAALLPKKEAARIASRATGLSRNELYRHLLESESSSE
jgi:16S rRNA (cytidine1402-2'-O)-methyltransferase